MENNKRNYNTNGSYQKGSHEEKREKSTVDRQWVALTAYQPVDIVTKTVEVPVIKTVEKIVPKTIIQEKIVHVPKNVTHIVEKIVEVPEVKYIDKIVEVPHIHYKNKYVPKIEVVEKVIERQKIIEKWHNRTVEVPQIKEVIRYKQIDDVEEVIKYIPKNSGNIDWEKEYRKYLEKKEAGGYQQMDEATAYQQHINLYNDYNEKAYTQNAYERASEYGQVHKHEDAVEYKDAYVKNSYYDNGTYKSAYKQPTANHVVNQASTHQYQPYQAYQQQQNHIQYQQQTRNIPRSRFGSNANSQLRRLPSEEAKPVGCCSGKC